MKKLLFFILFFSAPSFANYPTSGYVESTGWLTITHIYASTVVRFEVKGGTFCGTNHFKVNSDTEAGKDQYTLLMTAAVSGKKVKLETWQGCVSATDIGKNYGMPIPRIIVKFD